MRSLLVLCLIAGNVFARPRSGPVGSQGVPLNPAANQTDLYPSTDLMATSAFEIHVIKYHHSENSPPADTTKQLLDGGESPNDNDEGNSSAQSGCLLSPRDPPPSAFWYEQIAHDGTSPFAPSGANWKVFRNVVSDFNADPWGIRDSSAAIQSAIDSGAPTWNSRNTNSLGTTGQPAVVYIPSGTYVLNAPLQLYVGTVLMGNPLHPPVLKAGSNFEGNTLIYANDPHHIPVENFYIGIKNMQLESLNIDRNKNFTILDWSVSQATQLTNVVFNMPEHSMGHTGITMVKAGSGTHMGDLEFHGGGVGLNMANQQYEVKTASFNNCAIGIYIAFCFDCVFVNIDFRNCAIGLDMSNRKAHSVTLIDSTASNTRTVLRTNSQSTGEHSLVIENFLAGSDLGTVVSASGNAILSGSVPDTWVYGNAYTPGGSGVVSHQNGTVYSTPRSSALLSNGKFVTIPPPTYQAYDVSQFINVKHVPGYHVAGDGITDDTINLNTIISMFAGCKILFFPQGTYIVTNTLHFPPGSRVVGEAWSAISAIGSNFYNPSAPTVMVQVGSPGDAGVAQFTDMLFTVADVLPGCILVEVNMAGNSPGDVGFWNSHFRVGGARGSRIWTNCARTPAECKAAFMLLHLTSSSSAYIEDMWLWTADHDLDGDHNQTIATGRGILVEATAATWLHGTAAEHNTLYQYNFHRARNVFVGMQQSESPYWQGTGSPSLAPDPWTPLDQYHDPNFSHCHDGDAKCRMAWYNIITNCSDLYLYGSGFWTFFNHNSLSCQDQHPLYCQTNACMIANTTRLHWYSVNTHGSVNMIVDVDHKKNGGLITMDRNRGSWGGVVAAFLLDSGSGK